MIEINGMLSSARCKRIETTPFKWLVGLQEPLNISSTILKELVSRWSAEDQYFTIRQHLVPFSPFDVYITLGLGISGINVELQDDEGGIVKKLFGGEDITIASIVKKLTDSKIRKKKMLMYSVYCIYCLGLLFSIFREHLGLSLVFRLVC